ncbi:MAG: glycosyltransferase family 4 protein [Armatimonadota bacterium]|jgi:glycosyltransferase involved in cell wall biosynthesis
MNGGSLRILHIITPAKLAGAELYMITLAEHLDARGHYNRVLCKRKTQAVVDECRRRGLDAHPVRLYGKLDVSAPLRLAAAIRMARADIVHTHLSTASLWGALGARIAGAPSVATVQGRNTAACYRFVDRLIANSRAVKQHMVEQGVPAERIDVVYNAIDVRSFSRTLSTEEAKRRLDLNPGHFVVGTTAHLSPKKGHTDLLAAARHVIERVPDAHFVFLGDGPLRSQLTACAEEWGIASRVSFLGFRRDVAEVMSAYDVFVLASWWEPFGLVFVEAMALGVPVITTRAGGAPEVVLEGQTGMLVPPRDAEALTEAIVHLAESPDVCRSMGLAGPARAADFDIAPKSRDVLAVYKASIEAKRRGRPPAGRNDE